MKEIGEDKRDWLQTEIFELLNFANQQCGLVGVNYVVSELVKMSKDLKEDVASDHESLLFYQISKN